MSQIMGYNENTHEDELSKTIKDFTEVVKCSPKSKHHVVEIYGLTPFIDLIGKQQE